MSSSPPAFSQAAPLVSPPSLRSSPFFVLPPELTQMIVDKVVPPKFSRSTYFARRSTLYSLCLVSKLFHQFAKPLLYAVVYSSYRTHADFEHPLISRENVGSEGSVGDLIREIVVESSETLPDKFIFDIRHKIGLRSLVLRLGYGSVRFADLSELSNLVTLQLSSLEILSPAYKPLVNLQMLNLRNVHTSPSLPFSQVLQPTLFPSLTSLACYRLYFNRNSVIDALGSLVHQLESVSLDASTIRYLPVALLAHLREITLFDHGHLFSLPKVPYIRFDQLGDWGPNPLRALVVLTESLSKEARPGLPSVLYLPTCFTSDTASGEEKTKFEEECKKREIEVVFEDCPKDWRLESGISDDFSKRMKEPTLALSGN